MSKISRETSSPSFANQFMNNNQNHKEYLHRPPLTTQIMNEERRGYLKIYDEAVKAKGVKPKQRSVEHRDSIPDKDTCQQSCIKAPNIQKRTSGMAREQGVKGKKSIEASFNKKDVQKKRKCELLVKDRVCAPSSLAIPDHRNISKESRQKLSHSESKKPTGDKTIIHSHSYPLHEIRQGKDKVTDFDESVIDSSPPTSHILTCPTSCEPNKKNLNQARKSKRVSNFIGDRLQKDVVPVGPRFQAFVPEFSGTFEFDKHTLVDQYKKNSDNSKWLGTQIWPMEMKIVGKVDKLIGKGRTTICQCMVPSSVECVKHHSLAARVLLQCDLGNAFFSWKFDEMGEQVAKLWTLKEQQSFESLMKLRPSTNGRNFLRRALKSIPKKSQKEIVNYYFNVYIPRRISVETRSSSENVVDSEFENEPKGYGGKVITTSKSKKVKDQYLRV